MLKKFLLLLALMTILAAILASSLMGCTQKEAKPLTGITGITIQPEPGQYLVYDNEESAGFILSSVTSKSDVCDRDYIDPKDHATVRKGEPCLIITGQVESEFSQDKYMTLSARGYDAGENEVTYVLDAGPIWGVISIFIPSKGTGEFTLHLKAAPGIVKIELMPSPELYDEPPP